MSLPLVDDNGAFTLVPERGDEFNVPLPDQWGEPDAGNDAGIDDDELLSLLKREQDGAVSYRNGSLADDQANALEFYDARPFGDEVDGQSQVVTPDVAEVVDYMTVSVARTCVSGDNVVEFEARQPGREDAAQEATEAVSQSFMRDQDGYKVIVGWLQSGLIEKIGVVKAACMTERRNVRRSVTVDVEQLAMLDAEGSLLDYADNGDGSFTARTQQKVERKRYVSPTVPSEEMLFAARTRHEDDTGYIAQRSRVTRSTLIEMGFDRIAVDALEPDSSAAWWNEAQANVRWGSDGDVDRTGPMSEVVLMEEYIRADRDGDGVAELLKVFRVGDTILETEEVDEQPFVVFCPFPRAHRLVGDSLAEKVMDLQRIRSVITRQTIDGVMLSNRPRAQIDENAIGDTTIDDWLTPGPGVLVRTRQGGEIRPVVEGFDSTSGLNLLQFLVGERESRTGITRLNQGLDADALNKTATGTALMQAQGQQMEEYVARNFAEALGRLFAKFVRLMIAEGDPLMVRLDGEFREADPSAWDGDMPVMVRVGLGSGRKEQRLQYWQLLIQDQMGLTQTGSPLVSPENLYRARDGAIRDMGLGNPNEFYTDPATQEPQPEKPDPAMAEVQGKLQLEQQKQQQDHERAMGDLMLQQQKQEASVAIEAKKADDQAEVQRGRAALEAELARDKADFEAVQAVKRQDFEMGLARERLDNDLAINRARAEAREQGLPKNRSGGDLDK